MRRRVVVTGMGVINPLGHDVSTMWSALLESQSGVGPITVFDASGYPTTIAAEVKHWDVSMVDEDPAVWNYRGRHTRFAVGAAKQAVLQSGILDTSIDPTRIGVYLGAGEGNQNFSNFTRMVDAAVVGRVLSMSRFSQKGIASMDPRQKLEPDTNMPTAHVPAL